MSIPDHLKYKDGTKRIHEQASMKVYEGLKGHQKVFGTTLNDIQDLISLAQIDFLRRIKD